MDASRGRLRLWRQLITGFFLAGLCACSSTGSADKLQRIGPSSAHFACIDVIQRSIDQRLLTVPKGSEVGHVLEAVASALPPTVRDAFLDARPEITDLDFGNLAAGDIEDVTLAVLQNVEELNYCETASASMDFYLIADAVGQALLARDIDTESLLGNDPESVSSTFSSHLVMASLAQSIWQSAQ